VPDPTIASDLWDLLYIDGTGTAPLYLQRAERIAGAIATRRLRQGQGLPAKP
jgi:DNA-binding transcriptional regulator YhcF (GntR family)